MTDTAPMGTLTDAPDIAPTDTVRTKRFVWRRLIPLAVAAALVGIWQAVIVVFNVPRYVVPTPVAVADAFSTNGQLLLHNVAPTVLESLIGFGIGNLVAFSVAIAFVHSRTLRDALMPLAVLVQTVPIIAIAPILVIILGTGISSKIAIAALICFFPTLVNSVRGLAAIDDQVFELMRVLSANRREVLVKVRLYACLPYLFSALKITATASVIGAIVGEWVGSQSGLGYLIIQTTFNYQTPLLYATMIVASVYAYLFFTLVGLVERIVVRWKPGGDR